MILPSITFLGENRVHKSYIKFCKLIYNTDDKINKIN